MKRLIMRAALIVLVSLHLPLRMYATSSSPRPDFLDLTEALESNCYCIVGSVESVFQLGHSATEGQAIGIRIQDYRLLVEPEVSPLKGCIDVYFELGDLKKIVARGVKCITVDDDCLIFARTDPDAVHGSMLSGLFAFNTSSDLSYFDLCPSEFGFGRWSTTFLLNEISHRGLGTEFCRELEQLEQVANPDTLFFDSECAPNRFCVPMSSTWPKNPFYCSLPPAPTMLTSEQLSAFKYPVRAMTEGIDGTVFFDFVVCPDGSIRILTLGAIPVGYGFAESAQKLFESIEWSPLLYPGCLTPFPKREFGSISLQAVQFQ